MLKLTYNSITSIFTCLSIVNRQNLLYSMSFFVKCIEKYDFLFLSACENCLCKFLNK